MLKVIGGVVAGLVVGGAIEYMAKLPLTQTVTKTPNTGVTRTTAPVVKLAAWQWGSEYDPVNKVLYAIAEDWNGAHPEAQVEYTMFPELSETEYALKVKQAGEAGKPPTLFYMTNTTILTALAAEGFLEEPPSHILYLIRRAIDPTFHYMLNTYSPTGEIRPYAGAVVIGLSACALYYNKKLFQEAGLDPDKPPQTWDELRSAAKSLVKRDSAGKMLRAGYSVRKAGHVGGIGEKFVPYAVGNGAKILWKEGSKWYTDINQPPALETAQFLHDLIYVDRVDDPTFPSWGIDPFLNEMCAISGPLSVDFITSIHSARPEMVAEVGVTNIASPGGIKRSATFGDLQVIAVCSKASKDQKDKAWNFIEFFNSPTNIKRISNDIWNWTPYKDSMNSDPFITQEAWKNLSSVLSRIGQPHLVNDYGPGWLHMTAMLGNNLKRAFANEISVKNALERTYQDWTSHMSSSTFYSG